MGNRGATRAWGSGVCGRGHQLCPRHGPALINQIQPCPFALRPSDKGLIWVRVVVVRGAGVGGGTSQPLQSCEQQSVRKVSVPTMAADASSDKRQMGGQNGSLESPSGRQSVKRRMSHCSKNTDADLQIHGRDLKFNFSNNRTHLKFSRREEIRTEGNDEHFLFLNTNIWLMKSSTGDANMVEMRGWRW